MSHSTNTLESECPESQWHNLGFPIHQRKIVKHRRPTEGIHAWAKWGRMNMVHPQQLTKVYRKELFSNNHVPIIFWFHEDDII